METFLENEAFYQIWKKTCQIFILYHLYNNTDKNGKFIAIRTKKEMEFYIIIHKMLNTQTINAEIIQLVQHLKIARQLHVYHISLSTGNSQIFF